MVNFTKSGIPGFSVTDSFANVRQRLDDVREHNDFGFESVRGYLELGGNRYLAGIDQNPVTHGIECVELRELFKGDMSAQEFAGELAKIGSVPIMEIEMVWWPVERMSFFLYEDVPSAIGWWGKDLTIDKVKAIFAGRIEELDPNVYHLYKAEE